MLILIVNISFYYWRAGVNAVYEKWLGVGQVIILSNFPYLQKEWDLVSGCIHRMPNTNMDKRLDDYNDQQSLSCGVPVLINVSNKAWSLKTSPLKKKNVYLE